MTLLAALVCDSFVMQVSDRCLSRGGKPEPGEWNKAVVWCNLASIAYTGNAFRDHRETKPVDDWIAQAVAPAASTWDVFRNLMGGAEEWLKRSRSVHRQAFSLVGWELQPDGNHVPYAGLISNFHDERGVLKLATREFTWLRIDRNPRAPHRRFFLVRQQYLLI